MRITTQVALGTGSLVLLTAISLIHTVGLLHHTAAGARSLATEQLNVSKQLVQQIATLEELREVTLKEVASTGSLSAGYGERRRELATRFGADLRQLRSAPMAAAESAALDELELRWGGWANASAAIPSPAPENAGDYAVAAADLDDVLRQWNRRFDALRPPLDDALEAHRQSLDQRSVDALATVQRAQRSSWITGLLALGFGALTVGLTVRSIQRPLTELAAGTRAVAEGRFDIHFPDHRKDELAGLAVSFNEMVEQLRHLEDMKKDFVARVSHELRNPLVSMQETNQLLMEGIPGPLNGQQQRLLQLNIDSGRRLSALLTSLLDLSRLEAGAMTYDLRRQDLASLAAAALSEVEPRAQERRLRLRLELEGHDEKIYALCDRDRMVQVFINLLDNAVRHSPTGGVVELRVGEGPRFQRGDEGSLRRRIRPRSEAQRWVGFTVSDAGPGIPTAQRRAIFRKFHRGHRPGARAGGRRADGGVGLGLAICREIIEAHHGRLWVDDSAYGGARFWVLVPAPPAGRAVAKASLGAEQILEKGERSS
ncbi:MAG: HAMP domain-containing sensor histidine kinase [Acidobacteriota bacterium]